jgi:hypothetical protein
MAMMSVHLQSVYSNEPESPGMVPVELLDSEGRSSTYTLRVGEPLEIDGITPGRYTVRAFLPSGAVLAKAADASIAVPGAVHFTPPASAHEWLGWETLLGDAVSAPSYHEMQAESRPVLWMRMWRVDRSLGPALSWRAVDWPESYLESDFRVWKLAMPLLPDEPQALQFGGPGIIWRTVVLPPGPQGSKAKVILRLDDRSSREGTAVQIGTVDRRFDVTAQIGTDDRRFDGLLRYLEAGDLLSLGRMQDEVAALAEQMLYEKMTNAFGAVVGAYVLLALGSFERMHSWTANLAGIYDAVSDGAIIHATRLLRERPEVPWDEVRLHLLEAARRPTPILTEGVHLLVRGLRLVQRRADTDAEVNTALQRMEALAAASDAPAGFTSFVGHDPNNPDPVAPTGVTVDDFGVQWLPEAAHYVSTALPLAASNDSRDTAEPFVRPVVRIRPTQAEGWEVAPFVGATEFEFAAVEPRQFDSRGSAEEWAFGQARELGRARLVFERPDGSTEDLRDL